MHEEEVTDEAVKVVANVTTDGSRAHVRYLIEENVLEGLCGAIRMHVRCDMKDGAVTNPALKCVERIMRVGEQEQEERGLPANPFAQKLLETGKFFTIKGLRSNRVDRETRVLAKSILNTYFPTRSKAN